MKSYTRNGYKWTLSEEENVIYNIKRNVPIFGIAQQHQRSEEAVKNRIEAIVLKLRDRGKSYSDISMNTGLPLCYIETILGKEKSMCGSIALVGFCVLNATALCFYFV